MIEKSKQNQIDPEAKKINDTLKRLLEPWIRTEGTI
jgi:hypothetical protein